MSNIILDTKEQKKDIKDIIKKIPMPNSRRGKTIHLSHINPMSQSKSFLNLKNPNIEIIKDSSQNSLKIKKYNYYYLLDLKKFDINAIISLLDLEKINKIQEMFVEYPNGIPKFIFIKKLKKIISTDNIDLPSLLYGLDKFFCEIDYNGDGLLQWEEFTQFIIDKAEGDSEAKNINDEASKKIYNEKKMLKYKKYQICNYLKDPHLYKDEIIAAAFIPTSNLIVMNEYGTRILKLYNPFIGKAEKYLDIEDILNPFLFKKKEQKQKNNINKDSSLVLSKENKTKEKSSVYRVLYITRFQSLIAICLSDKRILFMKFETDDRIELLFELTLPILEKRIWYLKRHNIWVTSGSKLPKFEFYTLNELDIELQYDGQKYEFLYNEGHPYRAHYTTKSLFHTAEILDCIEITKPLLILTACLDGKIRLLSVETQNVLKIWNYHKLGIRQLDYNPDLDGGYVLSVGFEYFINLYNLEYSLEDAYKGKLEGSFSPIVSCQFIIESYMAISVDEEGNIRVWNIKNKTCCQLIPQTTKKCKINNLLLIPKYNKFIIYGNRIVYYESQYKTKTKTNKEENFKDTNHPFKVLYNYYYNYFYIATFNDIRVYTNQGKLIKIFKKLSPENFDPEVKIKNFIFENKYRKLYVGFSNGAILQFNAGNGSFIKAINEVKIMKDHFQTNEYTHTKDISGLYFYSRNNEENLLISTSYDGLINVYDEKYVDKSEQIKTIKGGHTISQKNYEIICLEFSEYLNIYATSRSDGLIVIWDFKMSKIVHIFTISSNLSYKINSNCLKFLEPFPVLASANSDGTLYLFEINKEIDKSKCILRARNYYKIHSKINICNIECMNALYGNFPVLKTDEVLLKKYFVKNYEGDKKNNLIKKEDENDNNENENQLENLDIVPEIYKDEIIDKDLNSYINQDEENKDNNENEIKLQYNLILGDKFGFIKIINLLLLFQKLQLKPMEKKMTNALLNLYKKEEVNAQMTLSFLLGRMQENEIVFPNFLNIYYNMILLEKRAHFEKIVSLEIIKDPPSFATCSKDYFFKIFNFNGECLGAINILPKMSKHKVGNIKWNFKIDDKKILEKEIKEVVDIFENIGVEPIIIGSDLDEQIKRERKEETKEKNEENKIVNKKQKIKQRFKKIIKAKEEKKKEDENEKVNDYIMAERYFVKCSQNEIEQAFNGTENNDGFVGIANQLIDIALEKKKQLEKKKLLKEKNEKENSQNDELNESNFSINKKKIKKLIYLKDKNRIKELLEEHKNNILKTKTKNKSNTKSDLIQLNKSKNDESFSYKRINITKELSNQDKSEIEREALTPRNLDSNKLKFSLLSPNKTSGMFSEKNIKKDFIKDKLNKGQFKKIKKLEVKRDNMHLMKLIKNKLKYNSTSRFFRKNSKYDLDQSNNSRCFSFEKTMNKFSNKVLPNLFNKIIFKKGETEKLLKYQFYNTAYKACCEPTKQKGINNIPIKTHYKNSWKIVKQYADITNGKDKNKIKEKAKKISENIISYINTNYKTSIPTDLSN